MKTRFEPTDIITGFSVRLDGETHSIIQDGVFLNGAPKFNAINSAGRKKFPMPGDAAWTAGRLTAMDAEPIRPTGEDAYLWQEHEIRPGTRATTASGEPVRILSQPNAVNMTLAFLASNECEPGLSPDALLNRFNRLGFQPA